MALLALVLQHFIGMPLSGEWLHCWTIHPAGKHAVVAGVLGRCQCDGLARSVDGGLARFSGVGGRFLLSVAFL